MLIGSLCVYDFGCGCRLYKKGDELKVLKRYPFADKLSKEQFHRQLSCVTALDYPNILPIELFFIDYANATTAVVQLPFCEQGTLSQHLSKSTPANV